MRRHHGYASRCATLDIDYLYVRAELLERGEEIKKGLSRRQFNPRTTLLHYVYWLFCSKLLVCSCI